MFRAEILLSGKALKALSFVLIRVLVNCKAKGWHFIGGDGKQQGIRWRTPSWNNKAMYQGENKNNNRSEKNRGPLYNWPVFWRQPVNARRFVGRNNFVGRDNAAVVLILPPQLLGFNQLWKWEWSIICLFFIFEPWCIEEFFLWSVWAIEHDQYEFEQYEYEQYVLSMSKVIKCHVGGRWTT